MLIVQRYSVFCDEEGLPGKLGLELTMKIGVLSLPLTGHLNPMTALARKLQSRGNEVLFFGVPDIEPIIRAADLAFVPYRRGGFDRDRSIIEVSVLVPR